MGLIIQLRTISLLFVGVIIFVRLGWFVAESGLLEVLSMVALAFFLLGATGISICAIATNGVVKGGGPYCTCFLPSFSSLFYNFIAPWP